MKSTNKIVSPYSVLFFDLDRTLWDYRANSEQTLFELIKKHTPELSSRFDEFLVLFYEINDNLWLKYRDGIISKDDLSNQRFINTFSRLGINAESFAVEFGEDYIRESPNKTKLFPKTIETLEYLKKRDYRMFLLTNGFVEVQTVKIKDSKLESYFELMITSEEAGYQKPHEKIFEYALKIVNADKSECLMIGDDLESDIMGAQRVGIDTVFFNPAESVHTCMPTFEIKGLDELKLFL